MSRAKLTSVSGAGLLVAASIAASVRPPAQAAAHRIDRVIEEWVGGGRIVGAVVLVSRGGKIVYRRAAGWADREQERPAAENTIFRLASMTKMIVSAAALALVDRGTIGLDDPVQRWLPDFRPRLADGRQPVITIRHLMTHTSGLSYDFFEPADSAYRTLRVSGGLDQPGLSLDENLRRVASVPLKFEPGSQWQYSISTDVLGAIVARAAGVPLPQAVRRYVTGPLGMHDTAFTVADEARLAAQYLEGEPRPVRLDGDADVIPFGTGAPFAAGRVFDASSYPSGGAGMDGTAGDYLRLLEAIRTGGAPILSEKAAGALTRHAIGDLRAWTEGEGWGFSLGAAVLLDPEAAATPQHVGTWEWGGLLGGHWFVDPSADLTVVVLTNTAVAGVVGPFPVALRDAIYGAGGYDAE